MPPNHLILCCSLLLPPSIFPSIRVFSNELVLHIKWPKYWSFSFNISPSNEYSRLISFRMDCLDLLVVQGTLKNLHQYHSSKASILWCSAFFIVQLSHTYMPARYDLNQIPYEYAVDVTNRFKGLDLANSAPEGLWMEVCKTVQEAANKTIPDKTKSGKAK